MLRERKAMQAGFGLSERSAPLKTNRISGTLLTGMEKLRSKVTEFWAQRLELVRVGFLCCLVDL